MTHPVDPRDRRRRRRREPEDGELGQRERVHLVLLTVIVITSVVLALGVLFFVRNPLAYPLLGAVIYGVWRTFVRGVLGEGEEPRQRNRSRR